MNAALSLILVLIAVLSASHICITETSKPVQLETIVVTASRRETPLRDVPSPATVIDNQTIQELRPESVDDLFRTLPGVDVVRRFGFTSSTSTVTMRGFVAQARGRRLVLLDGTPFNELCTGEVCWNSIPVNLVDRVGVVPGAASRLYGPGVGELRQGPLSWFHLSGRCKPHLPEGLGSDRPARRPLLQLGTPFNHLRGYTNNLSTRYTSINYVNSSPKNGWGGNLQSSFRLANRQTLTLGADWRRAQGESTDNCTSTTRKTSSQGTALHHYR